MPERNELRSALLNSNSLVVEITRATAIFISVEKRPALKLPNDFARSLNTNFPLDVTQPGYDRHDNTVDRALRRAFSLMPSLLKIKNPLSSVPLAT